MHLHLFQKKKNIYIYIYIFIYKTLVVQRIKKLTVRTTDFESQIGSFFGSAKKVV